MAESGLGFGGAPRGGRVWLIAESGERRLVAEGLAEPVTGLLVHQGQIYVSEGGAGRIIRIDRSGRRYPIFEGAPGPGNYHTNMAVVGPDSKLYFSQGAMTNAGIVGLDAYEPGWLRRLPHAHDVPGLDIVLSGANVTTRNPLSHSGEDVTTGAFMPFGTRSAAGQPVTAGIPCTAGVMRCDLDGSGLELVAWGLRNAYGLGFLPDGRLLAVDQGADDRGSRPIGAAPDLLFEVRTGAWYGWPDFIDGVPVSDRRFTPRRGPRPSLVLANHRHLPPPERALMEFEPHAAAVKFAVVPDLAGRLAGHLLIALFGDEAPMTAPSDQPKVGRCIGLIGPGTWSLRLLGSRLPVERPIDVAFRPRDPAAYIVDFGRFEMSGRGVEAVPGSGAIWRWEGWSET